jgi:hypothetical protein
MGGLSVRSRIKGLPVTMNKQHRCKGDFQWLLHKLQGSTWTN